MRVSFGSKYNQFQNSQESLQSRLNKLNTQIASGKKIQHSYENSQIYNRDLQLGYQETTLSQEIDVAQNAYNMTLNSDKALNELNKTLMHFKTKLLQVANQPQSPSSRLAIASELKTLKDHMINVANTSIGGAYLFSGTKINTKPIASDGSYRGNNQKLEALISSDTRVPFNVPGSDLFFGNDSSSLASITSNVKKYNLSKLHPNIMDKINKDQPSQEVFIKAEDTLRDLIGDNDNDPSNDGDVYFYLRGVRPDGTHFKSKFALQQSYIDPDNSTRVSDLLDRIGREFGNTQATKIVDVTLNAWGEIEIRSLVTGSSNLKFHLLASDVDTDNVSKLPQIGAKVTSFQKSPYLSNLSISSLQSTRDAFRPDQILLPTSLLSQKTQSPANTNTMLDEIFAPQVTSIAFDTGIPKTEGQEGSQILEFQVQGTKIYDVLKKIESFYKQEGRNVRVEIADGKILLTDLDASKKGEGTDLKLTLSTHSSKGQPINGIGMDYHNTYDDVFFQKKGSKLLSNASQALLSKEGYATEGSKLIDVSGDLSNQVYRFKIKDHNGQTLDAKIFFDPRGIYLEIPRQKPQGDQSPTIKIPVINLNETGDLKLGKPNEITYRQFMDTLGILLNFSNQEDKVYEELSRDPHNYTPEQKELYEKLLLQAQSKIEIKLNQNGQVEISDRIRSLSQMEFSMTNSRSDDFSEQNQRDTQTGLILHANDALTITDPKLNLFNSLNEAIQAVQEGIYRPDEISVFNQNMRNIGVQNSLEAIENLEEHLNKIIALNGSYGQSFQHSISKNEILKNQVQNLRAENMDADVAEAYNQFQNLKTNYDAALNSAGKINKMSILDYV